VFLKIRSYIFGRMKNEKFDKIIQETGCDNRSEVNINRGRATLLKNKGKTDTGGTFSVFG
jgi:metal-responsive CopG/Arc/MetJ family transcriptional regulator